MKLSKYIRRRAEKYAALETERNRIHGELQQAEAEEQRKAPLIEKAIEALDDKTASSVAPLYPVMQYSGELIKGGTRLMRIIDGHERIVRARADLWDAEEYTPENAPVLWEIVMYRDGYRIIPDEITTENPFGLGEVGWWGDALMESLYSSNVWTPADAPDMWVEYNGGTK